MKQKPNGACEYHNKHTFLTSHLLGPGGKKGGAVGAMSPAHDLSKPGGGGGSHTRTGPGRPPGTTTKHANKEGWIQ